MAGAGIARKYASGPRWNANEANEAIGLRPSINAWEGPARSALSRRETDSRSATPNLTLAINYDRRENLVAMGILPPPWASRNVNPFPAWTGRFVADPPTR